MKKLYSWIVALALVISLVPSALALDPPAVTGGTEGVDYTIKDRIVTILSNAPMSISGDFCEGIVLAGSEADIRLENLRIDPMDGNAITVTSGCDARVTLVGENRINLMGQGAVIQNGGALTLDGEADAFLTGYIMDRDCRAVIQGGTVTILGGTYNISGDDQIPYFACDSVTILGGIFSDGSTSENTIGGVEAAPGKRVRITQINSYTWGYEVVDSESIPAPTITGTGYTYENDILTLEDGADVTVSSSGPVSTRIQILPGAAAALTLSGITMLSDASCIRVDTGATLTLHLSGSNSLTTWNRDEANISNAGTLIIDGDGTLHAGSIGERYAAIIGGDAGESGGKIVINSGTIVMDWTNGSAIFGAGIGAGNPPDYNVPSSGGETIVNGGTIVMANKGSSFIGIGGRGTEGYRIEINGGTLTLSAASCLGFESGSGEIAIHGGDIQADSQAVGGEAIGGNFSSIVIDGGWVSASAYGGGAAIGGSGGTICISGGDVTATAYDMSEGGSGSMVLCGTAIGAGEGRNVDSIRISGGHVTATTRARKANKQMGAAIGSSGSSDSRWPSTVGTIALTGGVIVAGTYDANGQSTGNAIGMGQGNTTSPAVTLDGAVVIATSLQNDTVYNSGIVFAGGRDGTVYGSPVEISEDLTVPDGTQLVIPAGQTVTVGNGASFSGSVDGTLIVNQGASVELADGTSVTAGEGGLTYQGVTPTIPAGSSAVITDSSGTAVTVTLPDGSGHVTVDRDGSMTLPCGSTVQTDDGPQITISSEGTTVAPGGQVTLPTGGSVTITDGAHTTTVTVPAGGTILPGSNGTVTIPAGSTVQTGTGSKITVNGGDAMVSPKGEVTLPSGGSVTVSDAEHTTTVTVPASGGTIAPTEDGYVFLPGGCTVQAGDQTISIPEAGGALNPATGAVTPYYTVTFDSQGGSPVAGAVVARNSYAAKPADPTREGYLFTGWYLDSVCTSAWNFAGMPITADIVLYGGWRENTNSGSGGSSGSSAGSGASDNVSIRVSSGSVTVSQLESAVKKADEGSTITINAIGASTLSLPVGGMVTAANNGNYIRVVLRYGEVTLPASAIADMTADVSSNEKVKISVTNQASSVDEEIDSLLDQGAAVFDVSLEVGNKNVHSFSAPLTLSLTVSNLTQISDPHVLHILDNGSREYYAPDSISGNTITVTGIQNLSAFAVIPGSEVPEEQTSPFTDVNESSYYCDAVLWAVKSGITNGTSAATFSPNGIVSRAQMVTFLWRAHGSPKTTSSNPFTDVSTSDYYYDAVLWAVASGITTGTSAATFSPEAPVSRSQAVAFLWRAAGSPVVSGRSFSDVASDAYYADAVTWAVASGITNGIGANHFSPKTAVSRAQAVTFLYREQKETTNP